MTTQSYVVGFMFSPDQKRVALIAKAKPTWQRGLLNGIGGKVESGETPLEAMVREFWEETGCMTEPKAWRRYAEMYGDNDGGEGSFRVDYFTGVGDLDQLRTMTNEPLAFEMVDTVRPHSPWMVENVPWLIGCALDFLHDGRPEMITATYPKWAAEKGPGQGSTESRPTNSKTIDGPGGVGGGAETQAGS